MARKYRVLFINGAVYPIHLAISTDWKVHYFTTAMAAEPALRAEEQRFLQDMPAVVGKRAMTSTVRARGGWFGPAGRAPATDPETILLPPDDFETFVSEIARVARRGALFSVPNSGAIPRYAPLWVVPWHLLEGSHVNFFNVASFRRLLAGSFAHVEVTEYGELPVAAADGTRVYNHLFAVAMHADDGPG